MNVRRKSTHARARIGTYALSRSDEECGRLLRSITEDDLAYFKKQAKNLTPGGLRLLATIRDMTICRRAGVFEVRPFTRAELGNELRRGAPLHPHDIKLLHDMLTLSLLREGREAMPAVKMVGHAGDDLLLGAGWRFVYIIPPMAALSLVHASAKNRPYIEKLMAPEPEKIFYQMPPVRWPWQRS